MKILPQEPYYKHDVRKTSNKAIITRYKLFKHLAVLGALQYKQGQKRKGIR